MTDSDNFNDWIAQMPKAELHLHIDGSLQAPRLLALAEKNKVELPYTTIEEVEAAYNFSDLQSFLDLYYMGASVLKDEEDFYHLMMDYLKKCRDQKIVHTEIMVEPQTYFPNGVSMETVMAGFTKAIDKAKDHWGQSVVLILSLLRHLSEEDGLRTLALAEPFRGNFTAIGLASSELGNPPEKFTKLFQRARDQGYQTVAHAGEEGPPQYIWDSLRTLKVQRIDHGVRCSEEGALVNYLRTQTIPLTVCPLSNIRLCVFDSLEDHNILDLLEKGLKVTVNSDDPAYFGGFLNENYMALHKALNMDKYQAQKLAQNSFEGSFLPLANKQKYIDSLSDYCLS